MDKIKDVHAGDQFRRLMTKTRILASLPYVFVGLLLILIIYSGGREIEHNINAIETWLMELEPRGILVFIGIFIFATSLLLPESAFCIIAGKLPHNQCLDYGKPRPADSLPTRSLPNKLRRSR